MSCPKSFDSNSNCFASRPRLGFVGNSKYLWLDLRSLFLNSRSFALIRGYVGVYLLRFCARISFPEHSLIVKKSGTKPTVTSLNIGFSGYVRYDDAHGLIGGYFRFKQKCRKIKVSQDFRVSFSAAPEVMPVREAPAPPAPVPVPGPIRPRKRKPWLFWTLLAGAVVVLALIIVSRVSPAEKNVPTGPAVRTATVVQKDFVSSTRLHGIVEAVESHAISAPRLSGQGLSTLIITKLAASGSSVHRGDVLVEFDRQTQLRNVLDKQAEYRDLVEQIKKKQADQAATRAADETALKQAEDAEKTAELEVKKNEILSKIDAEKNQLTLEETRATLQQLRETFDLKRQADQADLRVLEIQRDRALAAVRWAQDNTEKMVIHSPVDGVAVINSTWKAGTMSDVQEGDEVRPGFPFMQIVNPARMQVRLRANQADIYDLHEGQETLIHLDAYPDLSFSGKVQNIAAVAQTSAFYGKLRFFTVLVAINGSDSKLLPDLSAAVDLQLEREPGVLVAPRDAIITENARAYVQVKNGSAYERREVRLGPANDVEQVILSGVEKGAVVLRNSSS
jgi:HlyD family secretion protein